jgi:hypothetical protein
LKTSTLQNRFMAKTLHLLKEKWFERNLHQ